MVRFGDVVHQCKEKVDREDNPFERYVEGGHMDSEDIHIRRWGEFGEDYVGPAFHRIFRKGQVLYGSRRTYLKKVAFAEFDGITANTTFVLETKDQSVFMQELLPFLMLTDRFTEHSIGESKGSTNPYINYPDIAKLEFPLPPIEEQKRIAEILWAADEAVRRWREAIAGLLTLYEVLAIKLFSQGVNGKDARKSQLWSIPSDWSLETLESLVSSSSPVRYGIVQVGAYTEDGVPTLAIKDLGGDFIAGVHKTNHRKELQYANSRVQPDDVLLSIKATVGEVAVVPKHFHGNISRDLARIRLNGRVLPSFMAHLLKTKVYQKYLNTFVVGSTRKELSIHVLRKLLVPVPSIDEQRKILRLLEEIEEKVLLARVNQQQLRKLLTNARETLLAEKQIDGAHV